MPSEIWWAHVAKGGEVVPSPINATIPVEPWLRLLGICGAARFFHGNLITPLDWLQAMTWRRWSRPSPCQNSIRTYQLLALLDSGVVWDHVLQDLRERVLGDLVTALAAGREDLLVALGPLSAWDPCVPLDGDCAGFSRDELAGMVARIRERIDERIRCRARGDAAGLCAIDDPLMIARRRAQGLDDERFYRETFEKYGGRADECVEFVYTLHVDRGHPRRDGRTVLWLQVGRSYRSGDRRQCHQIWVQHTDNEWYRVGG
jgi:hypothetical protein